MVLTVNYVKIYWLIIYNIAVGVSYDIYSVRPKNLARTVRVSVLAMVL